jgi:hypothetical protein
MASIKNDDYYKESKTIMCMAAYAKILNTQGYQIIGASVCKFGDKCNKAHVFDELRELGYYREWVKRDKSNIDLYKMRNNIIDVIKSSQDLVKKQEFRQNILIIDTMPFVDLLKFWYEITCFHRRIIKEFNQKRSTEFIEGFNDKRKVPGFYLENEDDVWPLERTLHMCEQFLSLSKDQVIHIRDVCCGNNNCKFGVHDKKYLVCIENMLTGNCSCDSPQVIAEKKAKLKQEAIIIRKQLESSKENKTSLTIQYNTIVNEFNNCIRLTHLTDSGLIPYSIKEAENSKIQSTDQMPFVKAVVKIVKPGGKK